MSDKLYLDNIITNKYRGLLRVARNVLADDGIKEVRKAFKLAYSVAKDLPLVNGEPYINHSIAIARICTEEIGMGRTTIISALLYEFVQNEYIQLDTIKKEFPPQVAVIIEDLTKISGIDTKNTAEQAENFRKLLLSLVTDVRVIIIKLAERLQVMRTLETYPENLHFPLATETFYLYAPLGHRLGLYNLKLELEDISLKYTNPESYKLISRKLEETATSRNRFIREFIQPIKDELTNQGFDFEIKGRLKSVYSIYNKMRKQSVEFEDVYDIFAIRVILNSELKNEKSDCWRVYSVVTDFYQPNPLRMRDWISIPKTNGYESLHTTVVTPSGKWVEVQIRTSRMNEIAEKGLAAHWKYKGGEADKGLDVWLGKIREILEAPEAEALDFLDTLKPSLYTKEIFVFTPTGDLKKLPSGATVLDFAFDIHSNVGCACVGAKVNGKSVPIRHVLQNGDRVEILTSKTQKPKGDWLSFVLTSKAKNKIKAFIKDEEQKSAEQGKEILVRRLRNWKLEFNDLNLKKLLKTYKFKTVTDLYSAIADEKIDISEIKEVLQDKPEAAKIPEKIEGDLVEKIVKTHTPKTEDFLVIDDKVDKLDYKLAKCCNPIFGDPIFGFITINEGVKIHRLNCPNAEQMISRYGYRIVKAQWTSSDGSSLYQANLKIVGIDDIGLVSRITDVISKDLKVNMRSMTINTTDGMFEGHVTLFVKDTAHLDALTNKLKKVKGVMSVGRASSI
ncbi:MAG: RelA/SpoT family protein [Bacteroidota bacterium]|nr:RelA/SpoT family protein [Bacteroidota bacterium]